jgi:hypothetical protein
MEQQTGVVEVLLREITDYCRLMGVAESTFGRQAVNDGKFVNRVREGGRITTATVERVRAYIAATVGDAAALDTKFSPHPAGTPAPGTLAPVGAAPGAAPGETGRQGTFRFFDNRQKYLLFVNTCSEKEMVAQRVAMEFANLHPRPPAVRLFDAGVGDGTVLSRVMRAMHHRFPTMPFYIVGKEISLEDVRLSLDKMADRFHEHPSMVLVMTNLYYKEAPWLVPASVQAATSLVWQDVPLTGSTAHEFAEQITALAPFLAENWRAHVSPTSGNPVYERPTVLVLYRQDHRFLLAPIIPKRGGAAADYDMVIASQPYRARAPLPFKAERVVAPLVRSLGPGGRLLAIHSHGDDPGMEIVRGIWPDEHPFQHDRHQMLKAVKGALGNGARNYAFNAYADARSLFRYQMHALPSEISSSIGTSTLFAAWNAAIYVGQIEDNRLEGVIDNRRYLEVTSAVLQKHAGLWFWDESYIISRRQD